MLPEITTRTDRRNHRTFEVYFDGITITVTVTSTPSVMRRWLRTVLNTCHRQRDRLVIGMGVQWTPPFFPGSNPPADTLQLCVGRSCIIFQLAYCDFVPLLLRHVLSDRSYTFVGIWNSQDESKLWMRHQLEVGMLLDLRRYLETADGENLRRASFGRIVEEYLGIEGVRLTREISMSDWDDEVLSEDQILQACVKAYVAFKIGRDIRAWEIHSTF